MKVNPGTACMLHSRVAGDQKARLQPTRRISASSLANKPVPGPVVEAVWGFLWLCSVVAFAVRVLLLLGTVWTLAPAFSPERLHQPISRPGLGEVVRPLNGQSIVLGELAC